MINLIPLTEQLKHLVKDDPVRPELDYNFRTSYGREAFVLIDAEDVHAVINVAYTHQIPKSVNELKEYAFSDFGDPNRIAVFYTLWSYKKGAGREILFKCVDHIKQNKGHIGRFVTLSPKTEMARKFHLGNGAIIYSENETTDNYEYKGL